MGAVNTHFSDKEKEEKYRCMFQEESDARETSL
jgi:hypothetical protein